jgi:hypothetical protein
MRLVTMQLQQQTGMAQHDSMLFEQSHWVFAASQS